jgi:hypothetical protein
MQDYTHSLQLERHPFIQSGQVLLERVIAFEISAVVTKQFWRRAHEGTRIAHRFAEYR